MSFFLDNWVLIAVAFSSGAMLLWPTVKSGGRAGTLNANDAVMLMNREKAVVIDVCEADEFAQGHINGAKNLPVGQLEEKLPGAVKNKATPLIFVCASGARANRGIAVAKKLGYEKVQSLTGGMGAWRSAGLPVVKS
ncbi:MAG: rhodanese-like domain-containing protein [Hydrogenophaga sp.]|uniref:rhodanese-like domain-containing protein n=1 Tax=Hydrogenophaga sp. TaxID=1904254 RepID=UPI001DB42C3D|nr:rhodanese-like domain-containing protein [Hydrogenophaga sp.]MBX3609273.1 rhodanese-like domain-containing protein [Hydrogenophaga sp.]